ncbi:MinD/ParA family protein [Methylolobus aquaticus]|nr:MinD/ParA family protein [Methylolobus aquaticus]
MAHVISVHSFRGGTGKSNITANLAALLASTGKRVGVIDTDIQSPGIHAIFGLEPGQQKHSLNDFLWGRCTIEAATTEVTAVLRNKGIAKGQIYLTPGSMQSSDITRMLSEGYDVGLLNSGFQELIERLELDHLLIDTHPGVNEETLLSIAISDVLMLILRPDRQDYQGTAVAVELARQLDVPNLFLLVNKAITPADFPALRERIESTYDTPVLGILPLAQEMAVLGSSDLFCLTKPDHPISATLKSVATKIAAA